MILDLWKSFLIVILLEWGTSTPIIEHDKGVRYEEYLVEHEISEGEAKNQTLLIDINTVIAPPRCETCNAAEKAYCMGGDLINDHCCCDKRYHEHLKFIPHTCFVGTQLCKTVATNCAEYDRLRECCCTKYVLEKWKKKYGGSGCSDPQPSHYLFAVVNIVNIFVIYKLI